jgi:hypothetical protein
MKAAHFSVSTLLGDQNVDKTSPKHAADRRDLLQGIASTKNIANPRLRPLNAAFGDPELRKVTVVESNEWRHSA